MRNYNLPLILALFMPYFAFANLGELFGPSAQTAAVGGQFSGLASDTSNNFYCGACVGFSDKSDFQFHTYYISPDFNEIDGIQTKNTVTHSSNQTGSADTDYEDETMYSLHTRIPLSLLPNTQLAISLFTPLTTFQKTNSGDGFLPEYVMYRSRYQRTHAYLNLIAPMGPDWRIAVGMHSGMKIASNSYLISGGSGGTTSHGRVKFEARPTFAPLISASFKDDYGIGYLSYAHELNNSMENVIQGEGFNPINIVYDFELNSLLYFDPSIIRAGRSFRYQKAEFLASLEYSLWSNYESPKVFFKQNGGVIVSTDQYEALQLKNTLTPKLGMRYQWSPTVSTSMGYAYRQSPFDRDYSLSGNTLDADAHIFSFGSRSIHRFFERSLGLNLTFQYHSLVGQDVIKTSGQEDGTSGSKIGAPGYSIGGSIMTLMAGVNLQM